VSVLFIIVLAAIGLVIAASFIGGPVLIRFSTRMKARPRLDELEASELSPAVAEFLYATANTLRQDGFVPEAYFAMPDGAKEINTYLIMLTNRSAGDMAMVTAMLSQMPNNLDQAVNLYVEFSTEYENGTTVDTSNTHQPSVFIRPRWKHKKEIPQIKDVHLLYEIHRYLLSHYESDFSDRRKIVYPEGKVATSLLDGIEQDFERQKQYGLVFRSVEDGEAYYRPTWFGAFWMTWPLLFPVINLRRLARAWRNEALLKSFYKATSKQSPMKTFEG
jgi:hypothetical protein